MKILTHQGVFRWQSPRKWKTFTVKSLSLFSFVMEAAILKTWSHDRNYPITNAHGQHERRHFRRVSVVCPCISRRSRLSSLGQHSCNAQNSCAKVWSPETLSNAVWSSNVFLKNFKTLIKTDGRKCISDGSPSAAWFWNHWFKIMYSHQMLYTQLSKVVVLEKSNADNLTLYVQCFVHVRGATGVSMIKETKLSRKMMTMMTTRCDSLLFILVMTRTLNIYESILWIFTSLAKEVMFLVALVSLSVCLSVCLTTLLKKLWTDWDEILWRGPE